MDEANTRNGNRERLGWLGIVGVGAIAILAYVAVFILAKRTVPEFMEYIVTAGHVFITVAVIIIIRLYELPGLRKERDFLINERLEICDRLLKEREEIVKSVEDKYTDLVRNSVPLMLSARSLGLTHIHKNRKEAQPEIDKAIGRTQDTLLMIGVAFHETYNIENEVGSISKKIQLNPNINAKFLLLNPHTTAAVLRAFLETDPNRVAEYLKQKGREFVHSALYGDWRRAFENLDHDALRTRVRFYRCDPTVWLVITDDRVFVEPYTFGRPKRSAGEVVVDWRMGGHMPVFEFRRDVREESHVAEILVDHFERLWAITRDGMCSEDGINDLHALWSNEEASIEKLNKEVFEVRMLTLEALHESLKNGAQPRAG